MTIKEGDLIAATHGRGFYVMDDLSALRQMSPAIVAKSAARQTMATACMRFFAIYSTSTTLLTASGSAR